MPYPRRVIIYLREKGIPDSLVKVAVVADPQDGNQVLDRSLPPIPSGSLPILAISSEAKRVDGVAEEWTYIRQSMAIINFLEELCNAGKYGFSSH
jgi:glutathione S-transferase